MTQPPAPPVPPHVTRGATNPPPPPGMPYPNAPEREDDDSTILEHGRSLFTGALLGMILLILILVTAAFFNRETIHRVVEGILTPAETYTPQLTFTPPPTFTPQLTFTAQPSFTPPPTQTLQFTYTPEPTYTPEATQTAQFTYTPEPTYTPLPTYTPQFTHTPLPTYTPVVLLPDAGVFEALEFLTTVRVGYAEEVEARADLPDLLKPLYDEGVVLYAEGYIEAGFDMTKVTSVQYDPFSGTITVQLPAPQITNCYLDETRTMVRQRGSGIFAAPSASLETEARRYALQTFLQRALNAEVPEGDIFARAQVNATFTVKRLVAQLNAQPFITEAQVQVVFAPPEPNSPLPAACY